MTDDSLSDSKTYTIHFTAQEYKKHQKLIYIGSIISQFLRQSYFIEQHHNEISYYKALIEIANFLKQGKRYSALWEKLARELQDVYDKDSSNY